MVSRGARLLRRAIRPSWTSVNGSDYHGSMRKIVFVCSTLLVFIAGCASRETEIKKIVQPGMDKDQVLKAMGNPSRSKRISGADKWSYDSYVNGQKKTIQVYFQDGKVQFVGADDDVERAILESGKGFKETKDSP
jgi:outer membrane protein assembly factor BamE (lipoprotein component of BamABCDE complex)